MKIERLIIPLSIILGSIIIGLFVYFSNSSRKTQQLVSPSPTAIMPTATPKEESQVQVTSPTATPTPTTDDLQAIKLALAAKLGTNIEVTISQNTGTHAKGNVREKSSEVGGGYFLAAKVDSRWVIVYDGQSTPTCSQIAPYNFPKNMVSECLSASGQVVSR